MSTDREVIVHMIDVELVTRALPEVGYNVLLGMLSEEQAERLKEIVSSDEIAPDELDMYISDSRVEYVKRIHKCSCAEYVLGN